MNRQQWAILLTGIGALLLFSVLLTGPIFEAECTEVDGQGDCDEAFAELIAKVVWSFFAISFGGVLIVAGVTLFVIDAVQKPVGPPAEDDGTD